MEKQLPTPHTYLALTAFVVFFVIFVFTLQLASAAEAVTGRYLSASGTSVVLSLSMPTPSPANLIVEQYLAPGNSVVATAPPAKKVDADKGKVKWLFRNTQSGNITLSIKLKAPLQGKTSAMVRYRDPGSGSFTELRIVP